MPLSKSELQSALTDLLIQSPVRSSWYPSGFVPDTALLGRLLRLTDPRNTTGGAVATAVDMWVAEQLRSAGLQHVLPRRETPFYISPVASVLHDTGTIDALHQALGSLEAAEAAMLQELKTLADGIPRINRQQIRRMQEHVAPIRKSRLALRSHVRKIVQELDKSLTKVLGEGRRKQVDVISADWDRGLELAVSSKTLALGVEKSSELLKNQPNRWEELDGDLKNLRGRFPLAAIGAILLVPDTLLETGRLLPVVDMMRKLTAPGRDWVNAYDAATILVVRSATFGAAGDVEIVGESELGELLPTELHVGHFFTVLLDKVLERSPITEHVDARDRRSTARGESGSLYRLAAEAASTQEPAAQPYQLHRPNE